MHRGRGRGRDGRCVRWRRWRLLLLQPHLAACWWRGRAHLHSLVTLSVGRCGSCRVAALHLQWRLCHLLDLRPLVEEACGLELLLQQLLLLLLLLRRRHILALRVEAWLVGLVQALELRELVRLVRPLHSLRTMHAAHDYSEAWCEAWMHMHCPLDCAGPTLAWARCRERLAWMCVHYPLDHCAEFYAACECN